MKGVALERMSSLAKLRRVEWLKETFGETSRETWYVENDYDLVNLVFTDKIATLYYLRWPIP